MNRIRFNDVTSLNMSIADRLSSAFQRTFAHHEFILGREVKRFEENWARNLGARYAIGCSNGTDALALALKALGVGAGDEVITTPLTFFATVEVIVSAGAQPVLVDVVPETGLMDPDRVRASISPRTKALLPVHLYGQAVGISDLITIAKERSLKCIEDAAQAHGIYVDGRALGTWGDVGCYSFFPGKNLGALGDAGAIVTQDEAVMTELLSLRDHGRSAKYLHSTFATNARLDGLQAAFLLEKLEFMDQWDLSRRKVCHIYHEGLAGLSDLQLLPPKSLPQSRGSLHLYVVRHPRRDLLAEKLSTLGVETGCHYPVPCHLQPAWKSKFPEVKLPHAEQFARTCLSLPLHAGMTEPDAEKVAELVKKAVRDL